MSNQETKEQPKPIAVNGPNPILLRAFRVTVVKLIICSFFFEFVIFRGDFGWEYPFIGATLADRLGVEPTVHPNFGLISRLLAICTSLLTLTPALVPKTRNAKYLMPALLWNPYFIVAMVKNLFQTGVNIYDLEVLPDLCVKRTMVGVCVVLFQIGIFIQLMFFHKYIRIFGRN